MLAIFVQIQCHPDRGRELLPALEENARHSRQEPGCHRWDWYRHEEDPDRFMLFEVYDDAAAFSVHKESAHVAAWKSATDGLIARKESGKYQPG